MTDDPLPAAPPERARVAAAAPSRLDVLPALYVVGFVVLASALLYLYRNPAASPAAQQDAARIETLQRQVQALTARLQQVEARPAPAAPDLGPISARVAALETRPGAAAPVDLQPLAARLTQLEQRPVPQTDLGPVQQRLAALGADGTALSGKLDALSGSVRDAGGRIDAAQTASRAADQQLGTRIDTLDSAAKASAAQGAGRLDALEASARTAASQAGGRFDALETRLTAAEAQGKQSAAALAGVADRAQRMSRMQIASAALEAGQRLGDIPGAPPALARFAHDTPPTEASLRLSFNQAIEAAQRASQPAIMDDQSFGSRLWTRAQQSVTVRQGERVLVGDPIAGVLAQARTALEAGDLKGAVATLDGGLAGPAKTALQGWLDQAHGLLDARAALAGMAAAG